MTKFGRSMLVLLALASPAMADNIRDLQTEAIESKSAPWGFWGPDATNYMGWGSHSNRLIPVYTFGTAKAGQGINLKSYQGKNSPFASEEKLKGLFDHVPNGTLNPEAPYFDQTNIFDIQKAALAAGKKHIILVVFDGMDWTTTWNAATYKNNAVAYKTGRGTGLHMQDYTAKGTTEFGWMVTTPWCDDADLDINKQKVLKVDTSMRGGYAYEVAGIYPWSVSTDLPYLIGKSALPGLKQAYTDSASSASSMTAGIKTYNASINVGVHGSQADAIAHLAQRQGYKVGVVTSVPISHATPGAAYAHNVHRDDYQDITRDLLGLPSSSHPENPLPGVDLLIGCGHGVSRPKDAKQGENFVPGNAYLTDEDLQKSDVRNGGRYVIAQRSEGVVGAEEMQSKAQDAAATGKRFFGYYGVSNGHLPFRTADGKFDPAIGRNKKAEKYTEADVKENPTLAQMADVALNYLNTDNGPFWLMVEAGDVDWANHDNNIDNSIGAVISGDNAVKAVTDWVEKHSNWDETVMIVTADHGHYLHMVDPQVLIRKPTEKSAAE
ncbi:alkaline phosphatase [Planctomicrobium sp. SH527]|uniref:alkaline phosphatase n=1 Tax=Planctomicrobium sp. SH527 TaxID=3448123 RepID=UPI003F5AFCF7